MFYLKHTSSNDWIVYYIGWGFTNLFLIFFKRYESIFFIKMFNLYDTTFYCLFYKKNIIVNSNVLIIKYIFTSKLPVQSWTEKTYFWIFPMKPDKNRFSGKKENGFWRAFWIFLSKLEVYFSCLCFLLITTIELENLPLEFENISISSQVTGEKTVFVGHFELLRPNRK